jgi:hypothetical protein
LNEYRKQCTMSHGVCAGILTGHGIFTTNVSDRSIA